MNVFASRVLLVAAAVRRIDHRAVVLVDEAGQVRRVRGAAGDALPLAGDAAGGLDRGEDRGAPNERGVAVVDLGGRTVAGRPASDSRSACVRDRSPRPPGRRAGGCPAAGSSRGSRPPRARSSPHRRAARCRPRSRSAGCWRHRAGPSSRRRRRRSARRGRRSRADARTGRSGRRRSQRGRRRRPSMRWRAARARGSRGCGAARWTCGADRSIGAWRTPEGSIRRLLEAMPKAELHLHLDGSLRVDTALELARTRGIDAPTTWRGMFGALVAPDALRRPGRAAARVRPADRAHAGRRGARADHGRAGRDEGRRERPLRRDPMGTAAPRRRAGCRWRTGSRRSSRGAENAAARGPGRSCG